jgi:hypothetical protein
VSPLASPRREYGCKGNKGPSSASHPPIRPIGKPNYSAFPAWLYHTSPAVWAEVSHIKRGRIADSVTAKMIHRLDKSLASKALATTRLLYS